MLMLASNKRSNLLRKFVNYVRKKIYKIVPICQVLYRLRTCRSPTNVGLEKKISIRTQQLIPFLNFRFHWNFWDLDYHFVCCLSLSWHVYESVCLYLYMLVCVCVRVHVCVCVCVCVRACERERVC